MKLSKFTTWTFVILFIGSLILVIHLLFGFITPMVMALVVVSLFSPVHQRIEKILKKRPYLAAFFSTLLVFLLVLVPLALFIISLSKQALNIYQITSSFSNSSEFEDSIKTIKSTLSFWQDLMSDFGIKLAPEKGLERVIELVNSFGKRLYESLTLLLSNLLSIGLNFGLMILLVFVFFLSGSSIKQFSMELIPLPDHEKEVLIKRFTELSIAIFLGNGFISMLEGLIGGFLFWCFDVPGALIFGLAITIAAFLPLIGSAIIIIPASAYIYLQGHFFNSMVFLAINIFQLTFLDAYIKPKLIGNKSHMHAVLVFLSIIAGVQVYGIFGLFYGPLLVTMFLTLAQIYNEHYRNLLLKE